MNTEADRPVGAATPTWYDDVNDERGTTWPTPAPVPVEAPPAPLDLLAAATTEPEPSTAGAQPADAGGQPSGPGARPAVGGQPEVASAQWGGWSSPPDATPDSSAHPARLLLGVAVLAAERMRIGAPARDRFVVGVGLAQQTAAHVRGLARRMAARPSEAAARTLDWASRRTGLTVDIGVLARSRARVDRMLGTARQTGTATVSASRAEADALIRAGVSDGIGWAQTQAVPQIVDSLVPHLVDSVVPRLIDGVMPEIRARVLPVVIDDLTNDPRLRDLVLEQSRDVVGEAAQHVRSATATADDRVEFAFRRLVGAGGDRERGTDEPPGVPGKAGSAPGSGGGSGSNVEATGRDAGHDGTASSTGETRGASRRR